MRSGRKLLVSILSFVFALSCFSVVCADTSSDTYLGNSVSYSLEYILNHFNMFIKNDVPKTNHVVGAVAVGGDYTGLTQIGSSSYTHNVASCVKGDFKATSPYYQPGGNTSLYLGNTSYNNSTFSSLSNVKFSDDYLDFSDAFSTITSEMNDVIAGNDFTDLSGSSNVSCDLGKNYKVKLNNGMTLDMGSNGESSSSATGNTIIVDESSGEVDLDWHLQFKNHPSSKDTMDGCSSLVFLFPNATKINVSSSATPFFGHIVAPNADINFESGNYNGCVVAKSLTSLAEGHMWPYNTNNKLVKAKSTSATLSLAKTVDGAAPASDQTFDFYLDEGTLTNGSYAAPASGEHLQTVTNKEGNVDFSSMEYTSAGTHYYKVYEKSDPAYKSSPNAYYAKVTVADSGDALKATTQYYKDAAFSEEVSGTATFENTTIMSPASAELSLAKTVDGATPTADQKFDFTLEEGTFTDNAYVAGKTLETVQNDKGSVDFKSLSYDAAGTHYYKVSEKSDPAYTSTPGQYYAKVVVTRSGSKYVAVTKYYKDAAFSEEVSGTATFENTTIIHKNGMATITKHSETLNGKTLAGAHYIMYQKVANTDQKNIIMTAKSGTADMGEKVLYYKGADKTTGEAIWTENKAEAVDFVTDNTGVATAKGLEEGSYAFVETKAPTGYEVSTTLVSFTISASQAEGGAADVATAKQADNKTPVTPNTPNKPSKPSVPKTGDDSHVLLMGGIFFAALIEMIVLVLRRKYKEQ